MMYFLKKLFRKKALQFLGRGGILYFDRSIEYYIDTQNFYPNNKSKDNYGVIIFSEEIKFKTLKKDLSSIQKKQIAIEVKQLLADDGIVATIE